MTTSQGTTSSVPGTLVTSSPLGPNLKSDTATTFRPVARPFSTLKPEIDDIDTKFDVYLVWRKNSANPLLEPFLDALRQHPARLRPVQNAQY